MKPPLYVRTLTDEERTQLEAERRTSDAFRVRRAQIVLASARGLSPKPIAQLVGCSVQTVATSSMPLIRKAWRAWRSNRHGPRASRRPWTPPTVGRLQHILHQSPRTYGKPTGVWTLALAAQVCYEQGVTERLLSDETIRRALQRLQTNWKRAKHWITSPDPHYARKKSGAIA